MDFAPCGDWRNAVLVFPSSHRSLLGSRHLAEIPSPFPIIQSSINFSIFTKPGSTSTNNPLPRIPCTKSSPDRFFFPTISPCRGRLIKRNRQRAGLQMELPRFIRGRSVPESAQPHLQRRPASRSTRWNKLMLLLIWAALLSISMVPLPANQLAPEEGQVKLEAHHNTSLLAAIRAAELHLDAQILLLNPGLASHHQLGLDVTCFIGSYAATNKDPDQDGTSSSGNNYTIHFINMNQEWAVAPARKAPHAP